MAELHWNIGWTLATLGLCWLVLSCVVALAIGQIIRRNRVTTVDNASVSQTELQDQAEAWSEVPATVAELPELETGSRQASGTRLKPVVLPHEAGQPARKVG